MDFIHCQKCFAWPQLSPNDIQRRFFLLSCGHLFCHSCTPPIGEIAGTTCPICQAKGKVVEVCSSSSMEIKSLFMDPSQILQDCLKTPLKVLQFQQNLQKQGLGVMRKMLEHQKEIGKQIDALKKENAMLREKNESLKREVKILQSKLTEIQRTQRRRPCPYPVENVMSVPATPSGFNFSVSETSDPLNLFGEVSPSQKSNRSGTPFNFAQPYLPRKSLSPSPVFFGKCSSGSERVAVSPYTGTPAPTPLLLGFNSPFNSVKDSALPSARAQQDAKLTMNSDSEKFSAPQMRSPTFISPADSPISTASSSSFVTASPTFPVRSPTGKVRVMASPSPSPSNSQTEVLSRLRGLRCKYSPRR